MNKKTKILEIINKKVNSISEKDAEELAVEILTAIESIEAEEIKKNIEECLEILERPLDYYKNK